MMYLMNLSTALYDQPFVVLLLGLLITDDAKRKTVEVTLVSLGFQFVRQLLQALVTPLTGVQASLFARLYAENRQEGLRTAYASLTRFLILALLPAGAGLIIMSRRSWCCSTASPSPTRCWPAPCRGRGRLRHPDGGPVRREPVRRRAAGAAGLRGLPAPC